MKYIGIDIGTSSICGVCHDEATRHNVTLTKANDAALPSSHPWEFRQDPERIFLIVRQLLEELLTDDVTHIGFSGQMHGILYVDADGQAVSPLYTWQDGCGDQPYKDNLSHAQWLTRQTGCNVATGYGLVTHFYNLQHDAVPVTARYLCTVMDYVTMQLCHTTVPLCEPSNAASLGFFDKQSLQFDGEALSKASIDTAMLPQVCSADTIVGNYMFHGRAIPVYVAIGDNQASFIGAVNQCDTDVVVTIGTSSQLSVYTKDYVEAPPLETRPLPGGGYILVGAALCGGCSLAMLNHFFGDTVRQFTGQQLTDEEIYVHMFAPLTREDTKETLPLNVDTTFEGTRQDPTRRGKIAGITLRNFTPENLVAGFMQGICNELNDFYTALPPQLREGRTTLVGTGNALRHNGLLRKVLSDTFGLPLTLSPCAEEAAMGAGKR